MNNLQSRVEKLLPGGDTASKRNRLSKLRTIASKDRTRDIQRELNDAVVQYAGGDDIDVLAVALRLRDARNEQQAAQDLWVATDSYDHQLRAEAESIQASSTRPAMQLIRSELADLVSRVRELDLILGDVQDASAAIRQGVTAEWQQLEDAVDEYSAIRLAQLSVYERIAGVDEANALATMLHMGLTADAVVTSAEFREIRAQSARQSSTSHPSEKAWVRWLRSGPDPVLQKRPKGTWLAPDRYRYVRDLCARTAPWAPDWTDLQDAAHAASLAVSATDGSGELRHLVAARDEYARLTGTKLTIPED